MKELDEIQKLRLSLILGFITEFYEEKMANIKPEPKPDVVLYAYSNKLEFFNKNFDYKPNLKLTYDGKTKDLKSVEKI